MTSRALKLLLSEKRDEKFVNLTKLQPLKNKGRKYSAQKNLKSKNQLKTRQITEKYTFEQFVRFSTQNDLKMWKTFGF